MLARLQIWLWYAFLLGLFLIVYAVTTNFSVTLVDSDFRLMRPTIDGGTVQIMDRRRSTIRSLERDDVICFQIREQDSTERIFGRVLATPRSTVSYRDQRLVVDGHDVADAPNELELLQTNIVVPRDTVFVVFDSPSGRFPLSRRLVRQADIVGRVMWK